VLDRNFLRIPRTQLMNTKMLLTMLGGKTVYAAKQFR
jgi:predicted amidohydrolase YtcJ